MNCWECDVDLIGTGVWRIVNGNTVRLCGYCDRVTPEYKGETNE